MLAAHFLTRPRRQVRGPWNLREQGDGCWLFLTVVVATIMVAISHSSLRAENRCEDAADKVLSSARTWLDLRMWFSEFRECDDGYLAEGVSEYVTASLAKRWSELPKLVTEIRKTPQFDRFILGHVDATADYDNLTSILENATKRCPNGAKALCASIANSAREALKEPGVAAAQNQNGSGLTKTTNPSVGTEIAEPSSPQAPPTEKELSIDHRRILGITLGEANLAEVQGRLGEAKFWSDGDAATMEGKVCYVTQGPDPLVVIFASNSEMAGPPEFKLTDVRILSSSAYRDRADCRTLPVIRDKVGTTSGLKIGISRVRLQDILGPPPKTDKSEWVYSWSIDRALSPSDKYYEYWLAREQECFEGKKPFYWVFSEIIVQFDGDAVVALTFSRTNSIC